MKYDVFISYRREGGVEIASAVKNYLEERGFRAFFDYESLKSGTFDTQIYQEIDNCVVIVVILPPHALDHCVNEGDWLRLELERGMLKKKRIIPLMLKGFEWPDSTELPESLRDLPRYNGIERVVNPSDTNHFDGDMNKLVELIESADTKRKPLYLIRRSKMWLIVFAAVLLTLIGVKVIFYEDNKKTKQEQTAYEEYEEALNDDSVSEYRLNELADRVAALEGEESDTKQEDSGKSEEDYINDIDQKNIIVDLKVRSEDEKIWYSEMDAEIGQTIQWKITGYNMSDETVSNVMARVVLPDNLSYVPGSTILYNSNYENGTTIYEDTLTTTGINIGSYTANANYYVYFETTVSNVTLEEGDNTLVNWANITINEKYNTDSALVHVHKD